MNRQMKIGFLLLVILILVGCATTPTPAAVEKKEAAATSAPAAPTIAKPSAPAPTTAPASSQGQTSGQEERAAKQELVWTSSYSQRWDPARSSGFDFYAGNMYIFGTLLRFDEKGNLIPWLAESYEVSKDGLLYTFKLRKDIKFNTGNPVRAKDIKYSWERTVKGGVFIRYFQSVEGAQEYLDGKADGITGITTPDDFTVQVRMNSIYRPFLTYTASGALGVVEAAQVEKDKPEKRWMEGGGGGAGPYMIQSFDPNKLEAILVPNPYYFGEKPILQKITYVRVADPQTRQVMFEGGQADVAWANGLDLTVLSNSSNPLSKSLKMQPAHQTFFWPFRLNEPPFDDVKFREAFRYAIDLEGTISKIMPYNVALDAAGVSESPVWKGASCNIKQNPERAQKAFKESRYAGDASKVPAIRAYSTPGGDAVKYLQAVQEQVRKVLGVSMELKIADTIGDAERAKLHMTDHPAGRQDPWPGSLMDLMWWSKSQYRLAWTPYQNDEIDALIDKAHKATDDAEHLALYDQIHQKLCDQYLFLPGWYADTAILVKPYVKGINANEFNGHIWNLDKVWIAKH